MYGDGRSMEVVSVDGWSINEGGQCKEMVDI